MSETVENLVLQKNVPTRKRWMPGVHRIPS